MPSLSERAFAVSTTNVCFDIFYSKIEKNDKILNFSCSKNIDKNNKEIITLTAHAHKPKAVLKEDKTPTGYYYCEYCKKYFSDETGTIQINEEDIEYKVTSVTEIAKNNVTHSNKYIDNNRTLIIENNGVKYDVIGRKLK